MNEIIEKESIKVENVNTLKDYNLRILGNTEQDGTPTPENPVNIRVVTGEQNVEVCGKNLLNSSSFKNITKHGITFSYDNNTEIYTLDGSSDSNNNTFSISKIYKINNNLKLCMYYISGNITGNGTVRSWDNTTIASSITFSDLSTQNPKIVKSAVYESSNINISIRCESNLVANNFKFKLMITDSDDTEWEPYQGSTYPLSLGNIELCKIGDYQDYIYKKDNKWWKHKEIEKEKLTSKLVWYSTISSDDAKKRISTNFFQNKIINVKTFKKFPIFCSHYAIVDAGATWTLHQGISFEDSGACYIYDEKYNTPDKLDKFNTWIDSNNVYLYYQVKTPGDEQITDSKLISQLNNLNNAILYSGENNIITTISPLIDGEGTSITLENTVNTPFNNIILKGNTKQQQYSGKNKLNSASIGVGSYNGIICTYDSKTGIITFNGACNTDNTRFTFENTSIPFTNNLTKVLAYYVSGSITTYCSFRTFDRGWGAGETLNLLDLSSSKNKTRIISSITTIKTIMDIRFDNGSVANNFQIKLMITDSENDDYEPYVGGTASPNPDYPQDIKVVTGNNKIIVSGKNLVPITAQSVEKNGVTFTINNNQLTINGTATKNILFFLNNEIWSYSANNPILEAGTYNLSFNNEIKFINGGIVITIYNENSKIIYEKTQIRNNISFSISEKGSCTIRMQIMKGQVFDNNDLQFQIEQGSTATDYEPARRQEYPINLGSLELCKIGDHQDYIYKKDDKWWKHKEIDKKEVSINNLKIDDVVNGIYQYSFPSEVKVNTKSADPLVLSKYYKGVPFNHGNISSWETDNSIVTVASTGKDIRIMTSKQTNLDDFKAFIKNKDLGIRAVLPSAVEEQITDTTLITQLNNLSKARTYAGETNIVATSDGNNLPVTNYIKAYSSEIINESYPYLDLKYNLPYTEKLENLDFYLNENGRLVIKNVGTYLCSISESEIPDMPEASETTVKIAGRDGDLVLATTYNPIQFSIVIYTDENLSPAEKIEERQKIYKFFHEMKNTFKTFGIEAASKFYRVKYAGDVECENHPKHLKFTLPFKSSVSYGYNFKDKELIGNNIAISNTIEPVGFKCIINGPATNPTISLNNNEMKYEASIVNNEKIIIDTNNSTVTSITDNNESNAIVHYNRVFPKIQNGKNELKILSGIDNPTQVKIEWNDYNL